MRLYYEQEDIKFYENEMTDLIEKRNYMVLLAIDEEDYREYVIFNREGNPIYTSQNIESIGAKLDQLCILEEFNII